MNTELLPYAIPYITLNLGDAYFTYACLKFPGTSEANPVIKAMMHKLGILPALLLIKALLIGAILAAVHFLPSFMPLMQAKILLVVLSLPFAYLTYRNYSIYQRKKVA